MVSYRMIVIQRRGGLLMETPARWTHNLARVRIFTTEVGAEALAKALRFHRVDCRVVDVNLELPEWED